MLTFVPFVLVVGWAWKAKGFKTAVLVALWGALQNLWRPRGAPPPDHTPTFTPHRYLERLPVEASGCGL